MEEEKSYSPGELFMLTVLWHIKTSEHNLVDPNLPGVRFDIILALVAFLTLIKLFLQFEFTPSFGPLYKMLQRMLGELMKFLVIWSIQLVMFAAVAVLAFGSLETFSDFNSSIVYFVEASLGNFDMENFESPNQNLYLLGEYFQVLFLLINLILMLNLVIAILSKSFSVMSLHANGLYCDTLVKNFGHNEWDNRYGCLAVAATPLQLTTLLSIPALMLTSDEETLRERNEKIALMLYLPVALIITAAFTVCNALILPIAYLLHLQNLFGRMLANGRKQIAVFLTFLVVGLPTLVITTVLDVPVFFANLYTEPMEDKLNSRKAFLENFQRPMFMKFVHVLEDVIKELQEEVRLADREGKRKDHLVNEENNIVMPYADFNLRL
jgi:hypothetical protein